MRIAENGKLPSHSYMQIILTPLVKICGQMFTRVNTDDQYTFL